MSQRVIEEAGDILVPKYVNKSTPLNLIKVYTKNIYTNQNVYDIILHCFLIVTCENT